MKCQICQTSTEKENQEYCLVCGWEFEYFFSELSKEEQERYTKKLELHKALYLKSIESKEKVVKVKGSNRYLLSGLVVLTLLSGGLGWKLLEENNTINIPPVKNSTTSYSFEPQMIHINKGSFTMESNSGDDDEKPPHQVTINYDFEIGKYEVTIGEYKACVDDGGCKQPKWLEKGSKYNIHTGSDDYYKKMCLKDNCPIIGVSWNDAKAYTKWLSIKTGKNYQLPTEAEWEFVARAGTTTKWSFGDNENSLEKYAWYVKNSNGKNYQVGTKKANPWGVYDMHGNVWEWCEDWYLDSYNSTPTDSSKNHYQNNNKKVLRGGSWYDDAYYTRSAFLFGLNPTNRSSIVGFRLLRTLP